MFHRLYDRLRHHGQSVQYEVQRMTPHGGWQNFYKDPNYDYDTTFRTPPDEPTFSADTGYPPGKYRCIKRVGGRIKTVVWTVESPDTDTYYTRLREDSTDEDAGAVDTDGGFSTTDASVDATRSEAGTETATTDASSNNDSEPSPLIQNLITEAKNGSKLAPLGLGFHEYLGGENAAGSNHNEDREGSSSGE